MFAQSLSSCLKNEAIPPSRVQEIQRYELTLNEWLGSRDLMGWNRQIKKNLSAFYLIR